MIYEVIVDISNCEVDKVFDYSSDKEYEVGARVKVPFGNRTTEGFIIGKKDSTTVKTKDIICVLDDFTAISSDLIPLVKYLKNEKNLRLIDGLRLCVPSKLRGDGIRTKTRGYLKLDVNADIARPLIKKSAVKQLALLERLSSGGGYYTDLTEEFGSSAVKGLIDKGIAVREEVAVRRTPYEGLVLQNKDIVFTEEQQKAIDFLEKSTGTTLVHGVTGSGKTEIYMRLISDALKENKTAIMLVPEISLTPQMLGLFRARFGDNVGLIHSGMSDGERFDEWLRLLTGEAKVALGARSAIFAPLKNVGVIIIDEEHDGSYVSESNPRYFTRDVAEFRAKYNGAKLILGSATPSLNTYKEAKDGLINLVTLNKRANNFPLPDMEVVDMRREIRAGNNGIFSRKLLSDLDETIKKGEQAMIFINRRGFSSFIRCKVCGYVPKCTDCEVSLTYHKEDNRLKCHYCGKQYYMISRCPECGNERLSLGRIGTETVVAEINKIFPETKVLRLDNDTSSGKDGAAKILQAFREKQAQVLVGTQMIVKGHDFKDVTLVGVLDADLSLYYSDYRSNENTFQLITQVAGRAGRADKPGKVVIQTYNPHHYVFRFAENYDYVGFYEKEASVREATSFPPFSKIARILVKSEDEEKALSSARVCYNAISAERKNHTGIFRLQAMRAPISRINKEYRFQIVAWIKSEEERDVVPIIYKKADEVNKKGVVSFVEINPTQMR